MIPRVAAALLCLCAAAGPARADETAAAPHQALSPKAAAALQLTQSDDAFQRQMGFLRLEALREPATIPYLQQALGQRDPDQRAYALRALAAVQGSEAVATVTRHAQDDPHRRVRRAAVQSLEARAGENPDVLPVLIQAMQDAASEVRMAAVDAVSRIDHPDARAALLERNRRERRRDVRRVLAQALKRLGP